MAKKQFTDDELDQAIEKSLKIFEKKTNIIKEWYGATPHDIIKVDELKTLFKEINNELEKENYSDVKQAESRNSIYDDRKRYLKIAKLVERVASYDNLPGQFIQASFGEFYEHIITVMYINLEDFDSLKKLTKLFTIQNSMCNTEIVISDILSKLGFYNQTVFFFNDYHDDSTEVNTNIFRTLRNFIKKPAETDEKLENIFKDFFKLVKERQYSEKEYFDNIYPIFDDSEIDIINKAEKYFIDLDKVKEEFQTSVENIFITNLYNYQKDSNILHLIPMDCLKEIMLQIDTKGYPLENYKKEVTEKMSIRYEKCINRLKEEPIKKRSWTEIGSTIEANQSHVDKLNKTKTEGFLGFTKQ